MDTTKDVLKSLYNGLPSIGHWKTLRGDNIVLTLHFPLTTILLLIAAISASELFSNKIECIGQVPDLVQEDVNSRCLSMQTYSTDFSEDVPTVCSFYDWVPFMFYISAFLFFAPRFIFRHSGGFTLYELLERKDIKNLSTFEAWTNKEKHAMRTLVNEVYRMWGSNRNTMWMICIFSCEVLNLLNIILQFVFLHYFMSSTFFGLGPAVLDPEDRFSELNRIFPKTVRCNVSSVQVFCTLTKNFWNQKLFFTAWMWFLFLGFVTVCSLVDRINRYRTFEHKGVFHILSGKRVFTKNTSSLVNALRCKFGDVLMFKFLAMHLEEPIFQKLLIHLIEKDKRKRIKISIGG